MRKHAIVLLALLFFAISSVITDSPESTLGQSGVSQQAQAGSWATMAPMPTSRTALGVAVVDDKIYAIGGAVQTGPKDITNLGTNEMYDPTTDTWTTKAAMPTPMSKFAIAACQGKIFCFEGSTGILEIYDPTTDTWTNKTTPPIESGVQTNVVGDKIYLIGGWNNFIQAYDPQTNSLTPKAPLQNPRTYSFAHSPIQYTDYFNASEGASVSLSGQEIFWAGSFEHDEIGWLTPLELGTFTYNPNNDNWTRQTGPLPDYVNPYVAIAATGKWATPQIYVFNSNDNLVLNSLVFAYNSTTGQWDKCTHIPTSRALYAAAMVDDQLYVIGGETSRYRMSYEENLSLKITYNLVTVAANERYTPAGYGTEAPAVSVLSPQSGAVVSDNLAFNISVNRPNAQITYSLDGQANVTATANFTLSALAGGSHNVTVYATDNFGNVGKSDTLHFTVQEKPIFQITIAAIAVIGSIAGLLVYLKKRKKTSGRLNSTVEGLGVPARERLVP